MPGSSLIGNLAVTLGLNTAAFERGATKAEARARTLQGRMAKIGDTIKGFSGGLIAGIGIAGIAAVAKGAFDMAAALDESAQKMGVSVEALQELNLAAQQSGVSQETLSGAMARLNKNLGALQQGAKPAVEAFAKLGLSAEDLKNKSPDQALRLIADALNKLPSVQERVAVGQQIMGRSFSELLPLINGGSAALDKYAETSRNQGQITTEEAKRLDELSDTWDRLKIRVGVFAAKVIAMFAELASKLDESVNKWYAWRDGVIAAAKALETGAISAVTRMVDGIRNAIVGRLSAIWENAKARINEVKQKFQDMYDAVVGNSYVPDMVDEIGITMRRLEAEMVAPAKDATSKTAAAFRDLQQETQGLLSRLFPEQAEGNRTLADLHVLQDAMKQGILTAGQYQQAIARLLNGGDGVNLGGDADPLSKLSTSLDNIGVQIEARRSQFEQWAATVPQSTEQITDALQGIVLHGVDNLSAAITDVIVNGGKLKDAFGQIAKQIIGDIIQMTIKMLIFRAISGMFGGGQSIDLGPLEVPSTSGVHLGFAKGGGGVFGGMPGVDKNILSLNNSPIARVSKGEQFRVSPANDQPQKVIVELRDEMLSAKIAQGADVQIIQRYPAMRADTLRAVGDKRRRAP